MAGGGLISALKYSKHIEYCEFVKKNNADAIISFIKKELKNRKHEIIQNGAERNQENFTSKYFFDMFYDEWKESNTYYCDIFEEIKKKLSYENLDFEIVNFELIITKKINEC